MEGRGRSGVHGGRALAALALAAILAQGCASLGGAPRPDGAAALAREIRAGSCAERAALLDRMASEGDPLEWIPGSPELLDAVGGLTVGSDKALALQAVLLLARAPRTEGVGQLLAGAAAGSDPVIAYHAAKALRTDAR